MLKQSPTASKECHNASEAWLDSLPKDLSTTLEALLNPIDDVEARRQIASKITSHVLRLQRRRKIPPKNPTYWLIRAVNGAFRAELDKRAISRANLLSCDDYDKIRELVRRRRSIPEDRVDDVVAHVWERFNNAVSKIRNLEHWANSVISDCHLDVIYEESGRSSEVVLWRPIKTSKGTKEQVERELAAAPTPEVEQLPALSASSLQPFAPSDVPAELLLPPPTVAHDSMKLLLHCLNERAPTAWIRQYVRHCRACNQCCRLTRDVYRQLYRFFDYRPAVPVNTAILSLLDALNARASAVHCLISARDEISNEIAGLRDPDKYRRIVTRELMTFPSSRGERRLSEQEIVERLEAHIKKLSEELETIDRNLQVVGGPRQKLQLAGNRRDHDRLAHMCNRLCVLLFYIDDVIEFIFSGEILAFRVTRKHRDAMQRLLHGIVTGEALSRLEAIVDKATGELVSVVDKRTGTPVKVVDKETGMLVSVVDNQSVCRQQGST